MAQEIPFYSQLDERDCGATCLRMVAEAAGLDLSMEELRRLTETDETGTDLGGIARGAEALGFETLAADLPFSQLAQGDIAPAVLHWDRDHFVVLEEASWDRVRILDPAVGRRSLTRDEFERYRRGPGRSIAGLLLVPGETMRLPAVENEAEDISTALATQSETATRANPLKGYAPSNGKLGLAMLLFAIALAGAIYLVREALAQGIDLQYREGLPAHVGALLAAVAAIGLSRYLVRLAAMDRGMQTAEVYEELLLERSQQLSPNRVLRLLDDLNAQRRFEVFELPQGLMAIATWVVACVWCGFIDWTYGVTVVVLSLLVGGVAWLMVRWRQRGQEAARLGELAQREAFFDTASAHALGLGQDQQPLNFLAAERLHSARERFASVAREYNAEQQLPAFLVLVGVATVFLFGLYALGFQGLQVSEVLMLTMLAAIALLAPVLAARTWGQWKSLEVNRLRLYELERAPFEVIERPAHAGSLTLTWLQPNRAEAALALPEQGRVVLFGQDLASREALVTGLRGSPNPLSAQLQGATVVQVVSTADHLLAGKLIDVLAPHQQLDRSAVRPLLDSVGLSVDDLPKGEFAVLGFGGAGLSEDQAYRLRLAQALAQHPKVLAFRDFPAQLSPYEISLLIDQVASHYPQVMLVINAATASLASEGDWVAHVERGELISFGKHEDLLSQQGAYYYQNRMQR